MSTWVRSVGAVALVVAVVACGASDDPAATPPPPSSDPSSRPPGSSSTPSGPSPSPSTPSGAPGWRLGETPLPLRPDGLGRISPTPPALDPRSLPTVDVLPPPVDDRYTATVAAVPPDVLARSTWREGCPVPVADLRYLTMSFRGFDGRAHTGEMIVHAEVATDVTTAFERLFAAGFPLEEMRVTRRDELDAHPTGDGGNTSAFVCRPKVGQTSWSAHARGLAIDVNPFHNPYLKGDIVIPELASTYADRSRVRPGMITRGDVVTGAFAAVGWSWGGDWRSPLDLMHFSRDGD